MKILGKSVSAHFISFYEQTIVYTGEPQFFPTPQRGMGSCQYKNKNLIIELRLDLNKASFEHHIAHEMIHAVQIIEGWPIIASRYSRGTPIGEVGIMLNSIIHDLNDEDRLKEWSFDSTHITHEQYDNLKKAVLSSDIPTKGGLRWCNASLMYAYAYFTQPNNRWNSLKKLFNIHSPHIEAKGEELVTIIKASGWNTSDQALNSLIAIRESLGFSVQTFQIKDKVTEKVY